MARTPRSSSADPAGSGAVPSGEYANRTLALAFATIERPQVVQRLILSARNRFPELPIYVADQSLDVAAMSSFYAQMGVNVVRMPFDAGVCASRNRLVAAMKEEFFVLCDDDFVFGARTDFAEALRILRHQPDIGVVGGKLYDFDGNIECSRQWEHYLHLDRANRTLTLTPIYRYAPRARSMGTTRFYLSDTVMNFAVMRRAIFAYPGVQWDERFKSNGEHEDFYLNLKFNSPFRVAYLPTMVAYHHHPEAFVSYRFRLRDRLDGWGKLLAKWEIDQHLEHGLGVRSVQNLDLTVAEDDAVARFFLNDNLSLRRTSQAEALLVEGGTDLSAVGLVDEAGESQPASAPTARLLLRADGSEVVAGRDAKRSSPAARESSLQSMEDARAMHSLEPLGPMLSEGSIAQAAVHFRFNPVVRTDADFVLWYRFASADASAKTAPPAARGALAVRLRWFGDDGRVLVWESDDVLLDAARTDYWAPALVEVPVYPTNSAYLRFQVVAGQANHRRILGAGFLSASQPVLSGTGLAQETTAPALDVLAVEPWSWGEAGIAVPALDLRSLTCRPSGRRLVPEPCPQVPNLIMLPLSGIEDADAIFLHGWPGLGTPVAMVRLPPKAFGALAGETAPRYIALPRVAQNFVRVVGFSREKGFQDIPIGAGVTRVEALV